MNGEIEGKRGFRERGRDIRWEREIREKGPKWTVMRAREGEMELLAMSYLSRE